MGVQEGPALFSSFQGQGFTIGRSFGLLSTQSAAAAAASNHRLRLPSHIGGILSENPEINALYGLKNKKAKTTEKLITLLA